MDKSFCRYMQCNMSFSHHRQRDQHEALMHKDLLKDTALLLLDKIINSNCDEALNKKVLKIPNGKISYNEAKRRISEDTEESKAILKVLQYVVENYFLQYPEYGMEQMIRISEFKIR